MSNTVAAIFENARNDNRALVSQAAVRRAHEALLAIAILRTVRGGK